MILSKSCNTVCRAIRSKFPLICLLELLYVRLMPRIILAGFGPLNTCVSAKLLYLIIICITSYSVLLLTVISVLYAVLPKMKRSCIAAQSDQAVSWNCGCTIFVSINWRETKENCNYLPWWIMNSCATKHDANSRSRCIQLSNVSCFFKRSTADDEYYNILRSLDTQLDTTCFTTHGPSLIYLSLPDCNWLSTKG